MLYTSSSGYHPISSKSNHSQLIVQHQSLLCLISVETYFFKKGHLSFLLYQYFPINHGQLFRPVVELIFHGWTAQPTPNIATGPIRPQQTSEGGETRTDQTSGGGEMSLNVQKTRRPEEGVSSF